MSKQGFDFRWGVPFLDNPPGYAKVYEFMLDHYAEVITRTEFLCIIHLARYHYNSEQGESRPALTTIAKQMGYAHKNSVWQIIQSLESKGMLSITRRAGFTSIYNAKPFTRRMMALAGITTGGVTTQCDGGITTQCDGGITTQCDRVSQPVVPEEQKEGEIKKRNNNKKPVVVSSQSSKKPTTKPTETDTTTSRQKKAAYNALMAVGIDRKVALRFTNKIEHTRILQVCLTADLKEGIDDKAAWIVAALNNGWAVRVPRDDEKPKSKEDRLLAQGKFRIRNPRTGDWEDPPR